MSRRKDSVTAQAGVREVSFEAVVQRADGTTENLGTIAYWHESRWNRLRWRLRHFRGVKK